MKSHLKTYLIFCFCSKPIKIHSLKTHIVFQKANFFKFIFGKFIYLHKTYITEHTLNYYAKLFEKEIIQSNV